MCFLKKHIVTNIVKKRQDSKRGRRPCQKASESRQNFVVDNLIYLMKASYIVLSEGLTIMVSQLLAMPHCNSKLAANTQNYSG